jgi:hypothetical protein
MTFGGGNLRGQNICGVAKPVTAENSGHSNNQLIFNLLNTPILRKMDSSDCSVYAHPPPNVISQGGTTLQLYFYHFIFCSIVDYGHCKYIILYSIVTGGLPGQVVSKSRHNCFLWLWILSLCRIWRRRFSRNIL